MQSVVAIMEGALACPVYANEAKKAGECVVYAFNTTWYNGARREARMKCHIAAGSMARAIEIENALDRALVPAGDKHLSDTVTMARRNGGGWLIDGDMHIRIAYYDFVLRPERSN